MHFCTNRIWTYLLAGLVTMGLGGVASAQTPAVTVAESTMIAEPQATPSTGPAPTSTVGTTDVEPAPVATAGEQQPPLVQTMPAELASRPASWTANAGFESDSHNNGYGYIGPYYAKPFSRHGAWLAGANINYLFYEYPSSDGVVHVGAPGFSARGGVRFGETNYFQATAGPSWKWRRIEDRDVFGNTLSSRRDNVMGVGVGFYGSFNPTSHSNVVGMYDFSSSDNYNWASAAFKQQISNFDWSGSIANFVGAEIIGQGNDDIHTTQYGGFWETSFVPARVSLRVRAGWKRSTFPLGGDDRSGPWFAIGFWHRIQ